MSLLVAGNETTRHPHQRGLIALAQHPQQRVMLAADESPISAGRRGDVALVTPIVAMGTTNCPVTLHDTDVGADEYLVMPLRRGQPGTRRYSARCR